jgi:NADH:ubiquinone oxidoreductase subunit 2 (subunit N)
VIALAGMPPLDMFWSEVTIIMAASDTGYLLLSILMVVNIAISAAYCLRMIQIIVVKDATPVSKKATEVPISMLIPILTLVALTIFIGIFPATFFTVTGDAAKVALNIQAYVEAVLTG